MATYFSSWAAGSFRRRLPPRKATWVGDQAGSGIRHGRYPDFMAYFHKYVAKCQNALRGRFENLWSSEHASVVRLVEPDDILDKMIYALTNPVKDPLVDHVWEWPGVNSYSATVDGVTLTAVRPAHFFRKDGSMPEVATLTISRPPGFDNMSDGNSRLSSKCAWLPRKNPPRPSAARKASACSDASVS